ncbi:MAG: hypothetical protein WEA35_06365 [Candidatus Nanopelagicales bacterium]
MARDRKRPRRDRLTVELHRVNDLRIALPETEEFLRADLTPGSGTVLEAVGRPRD